MNTHRTQRLVWTLILASTAASVAAAPPELPAQALTRQQVVADLRALQATNRWDEPSAQWVLLRPVPPGEAGPTRAAVRADTAAFFGLNHWDESRGGWILNTAAPPARGLPTRAEVAASTRLFLETHTRDEQTQSWVEHPRARLVQ